jgi:hypothetical protein
MVTEDFIEVFGIMFEMCFDVMNDVRRNDILELFGGYVEIFLFDDGI